MLTVPEVLVKREGSAVEEWVQGEVILIIKNTRLRNKTGGGGLDRSPKTKLKTWP